MHDVHPAVLTLFFAGPIQPEKVIVELQRLTSREIIEKAANAVSFAHLSIFSSSLCPGRKGDVRVVVFDLCDSSFYSFDAVQANSKVIGMNVEIVGH
jgi:hypothetical protein